MSMAPESDKPNMKKDWLENLKAIVRKRPLIIFQFDGEEWCRLRESRRGVSEFTIARAHDLLEKVKTPTACFIFGQDDGEERAYFGLVSSRSPVTTLESRIKVKRAVAIQPPSKSGLRALVTDAPHAGTLQTRLNSAAPVIPLSPKLSAHLIDKLAAIDSNRGPMRSVMSSLEVPRYYRSMSAMQEDAVQTALRAFGLAAGDQAVSLDLVSGQDTALARVNIIEDSVVEHDARSVPQYDLVGSNVTGHAVFEKGRERLEIFTANRRALEKVFGVDLIYLNVTRQNIVMVQYKMLEPHNTKDDEDDWIYRPDGQLDVEIKRMRLFAKNHLPGPFEYRLNSQAFYLKFVKRNGALKNAAIVIPVDHFEMLRNDPSCKGPRGAVRVSFDALTGRYLRQGPFLDLIRAGYIGAHAQTTSYLKPLVEAVVNGDRAVVAAIQSYDESKTNPFDGVVGHVTDVDPTGGLIDDDEGDPE